MIDSKVSQSLNVGEDGSLLVSLLLQIWEQPMNFASALLRVVAGAPAVVL